MRLANITRLRELAGATLVGVATVVDDIGRLRDKQFSFVGIGLASAKQDSDKAGNQHPRHAGAVNLSMFPAREQFKKIRTKTHRYAPKCHRVAAKISALTGRH